MSRCKVRVEPSALLLLAGFVLLSSPALLAALLLAALCHELGHYGMLRLFDGTVRELHLSLFGAEMRITGKMSYGQELWMTVAGPGINLLLAAVCHLLGRQWEILYLFAGAQTVLGVFNLLPMKPLDGGSILWIVVAYFTEPYLADRVVATMGLVTALGLCAGAGYLFCRVGGTPFFLLAALGLLRQALQEKGLVKCRKKR